MIYGGLGGQNSPQIEPKKLEFLPNFTILASGDPRGGSKRIIKILKAAFLFSVKEFDGSAALSLYTLIDHRRVSYIYKKYITRLRCSIGNSRNRAFFGTALTLAT